MLSPTLAVNQLLSTLSAAWTLRFIRRAAACLIFPLRKREAHFTISFHVLLLIHSIPGDRFFLGLTHLLAASASKVVVFASFGPSGRVSGNFWRACR
jgi:hypothetical protein